MSQSIKHADRKYVLITGSTGLVGQYLVRELLASDQRLALVVRPSKKLNAEERVESFMQRWESEAGRPLPRPVVLTGDVCEPDLGLNEESLAWVDKHCGRVIHSAAVLTFHGASMDDDPWRTNLGGTRHVIDLCERFGVQELHYLSTAYVCGKRTDLVMETDLDCGQDFRNDYEKCKCQAEKLVHGSKIASKTIYRPAVIVGDSQSGYTVTYHGLYLYLRLMATLVPQQKRNANGVIETKLVLPIDGDEPRNLVPVDWVADVVAKIFLDRSAHGQTYHLTPDEHTSARQVIEYGYEYFGSEGVEFAGSGAPRDATSEFAAKYFENAGMYEDYETSDPEFDKRQLVKVAGDLKCPPVDRDMVFRFMDFGAADKWGKKRPKPPSVPFWGREEQESILAAATQLGDLMSDSTIGIDLHGPGGGQWKIVMSETGELELLPGLPAGDSVIIEASTLDLASELGGTCWKTLLGSAAVAKI